MLTGLAWSACSWAVRCWQRIELRKITFGKSDLFFFPLHHYSKLNKKGRPVGKGKLLEPTSLSLNSFEGGCEQAGTFASRCLHDTTSHLSGGDLCSKLQDGGWWGGGKVLEKALWEFGRRAWRQRKPITSYIQGLKQTLGWAAAC